MMTGNAIGQEFPCLLGIIEKVLCSFSGMIRVSLIKGGKFINNLISFA